MSRQFELYLSDNPDLEDCLRPLGWERLGGSGDSPLELLGPEWESYFWNPTEMSPADAPQQALALQPGISWHVEVVVNGSPSATALTELLRAIDTVAQKYNGVVSDGSHLWAPANGARSTISRSPADRDSEWLKVCWWFNHPSLTTLSEVTDFLRALERVLPEALPKRWGPTEPYSSSMEMDGLDGLAQWVHASTNKGRSVVLTAPPPFANIWLNNPGRWLGGTWESQLPLRTIELEAAGSVLSDPAWARQLPVLFCDVCKLLEPFYAEARVVGNIKWRGPIRRVEPPLPYPTNRYSWCGFPRIAPIAMAIGAPYSSLWSGALVEDRCGAIVYSSDVWPRPPLDGVPVASDDFLQEFDPKMGEPELPNRRPPIWPFPANNTHPSLEGPSSTSEAHHTAITPFTAAADANNLRHALDKSLTSTLCGINRSRLKKLSAFFVVGATSSCEECAEHVITED